MPFPETKGMHILLILKVSILYSLLNCPIVLWPAALSYMQRILGETRVKIGQLYVDL